MTCHYLGEDWEMVSHCLTMMPLEERHTAANIAEWIEDVTAKFNIPPESVVHENGANVIAAAKILQKKGMDGHQCDVQGTPSTWSYKAL